MIVVPALTPVTTPDELMVATEVVPLVHAPPETVLDKVIVNPVHTLAEPLIVPAVGAALIETTAVTLQPVPSI